MARYNVCRRPNCPTITTDGTTLCPPHTAEYNTQRGSSTARGYGTAHRALRTQWQARIDSGEPIYCADGCGQRITGSDWHLGHDHTNGGYLGPQTVRHNTSDGGRRGAQTRNNQ